ncbi:MAG: hypothetical protein Ct9H300mP12_03850 [Acidimicrobiales bacterium]|nr:MAG: hypothetical protein Ct9H300mP12_03850 [Acidimicrobiales bacterium]
MDYHRIFGGQLLAQTIILATATGAGRTIRSLAVCFPGRILGQAFSFEIESSHTGRTFATRRISAEQDGRPFFPPQSLAPFPRGRPGKHRETRLPTWGTGRCRTGRDAMFPWEPEWSERSTFGTGLSVRPSTPSGPGWGVDLDTSRPTTRLAGLRPRPDGHRHGPSPPEGISQAERGDPATAVTGHSIWFHRPFRIDDWCLITSGRQSRRSPSLWSATPFFKDGMLVASLPRNRGPALRPEEAMTSVDFDPFSREFFDDPFATYARCARGRPASTATGGTSTP